MRIADSRRDAVGQLLYNIAADAAVKHQTMTEQCWLLFR